MIKTESYTNERDVLTGSDNVELVYIYPKGFFVRSKMKRKPTLYVQIDGELGKKPFYFESAEEAKHVFEHGVGQKFDEQIISRATPHYKNRYFWEDVSGVPLQSWFRVSHRPEQIKHYDNPKEVLTQF